MADAGGSDSVGGYPTRPGHGLVPRPVLPEPDLDLTEMEDVRTLRFASWLG